MSNINRTQYHELNKILWDMHEKFINPKTALTMYERRWSMIEKERIHFKEKRLIAQLVREYGNGLFMPAA
ncbi:hypothetical protein [Vibrio sp. E150_018]